MFKWRFAKSLFSVQPVPAFSLEGLEDRRLLSAAHFAPFHGRFDGGLGRDGGRFGAAGATIQFAQAPAAVQTGLQALATTDSLTAPTATQTVFLGNANGVETYTIDITGVGTDSRLTVDLAGHAVAAPTLTTTTFDQVANTTVTNQLTAIATALNLTAPTASTTVNVVTAAAGSATYTVTLSASSTTTTHRKAPGVTISVDANGNPVGNQRLPLSVLSAAIQTGLTTNAPAGAVTLAQSYLVNIRTENGVTFYSATYKTTGIQTTVTVNSAGVLTSLPSTSKVQFSTLPDVARTELQALATAAGVTDTIGDTQTVQAYDQANGTTIYSVKLSLTTTNASGKSITRPIVFSVDQAGNPTVPPIGEFADRGPGGGFGGFARGQAGPGGNCQGGAPAGFDFGWPNSNASDSSASSSNSSTSAKAKAVATISKVVKATVKAKANIKRH